MIVLLRIWWRQFYIFLAVWPQWFSWQKKLCKWGTRYRRKWGMVIVACSVLWHGYIATAAVIGVICRKLNLHIRWIKLLQCNTWFDVTNKRKCEEKQHQTPTKLFFALLSSRITMNEHMNLVMALEYVSIILLKYTHIFLFSSFSLLFNVVVIGKFREKLNGIIHS